MFSKHALWKILGFPLLNAFCISAVEFYAINAFKNIEKLIKLPQLWSENGMATQLPSRGFLPFFIRHPK